MALPSFPWIDVVILLAMIVLNGVFAMSELAIVSSRKARLEAMARAKKRGARTALALAADPGKILSTTQIGITLIGESLNDLADPRLRTRRRAADATPAD